MKDIGSKIGIFIILIAVILLSNVFSYVMVNLGDSQSAVPIERVTYETTLKNSAEYISPSFDTYVIPGGLYDGDIAPIDFQNSLVLDVYQDLVEIQYALNGINFGGQYSVVTWSCGVACQSSVVINAYSGRVIASDIISEHGLSFSPTSNLLIINPPQYILDEDIRRNTATDYYVLKQGVLRLIVKEIDGRDTIDGCVQAPATAYTAISDRTEVFETPCVVPFGWELVIHEYEKDSK